MPALLPQRGSTGPFRRTALLSLFPACYSASHKQPGQLPQFRNFYSPPSARLSKGALLLRSFQPLAVLREAKKPRERLAPMLVLFFPTRARRRRAGAKEARHSGDWAKPTHLPAVANGEKRNSASLQAIPAGANGLQPVLGLGSKFASRAGQRRRPASSLPKRTRFVLTLVVCMTGTPQRAERREGLAWRAPGVLLALAAVGGSGGKTGRAPGFSQQDPRLLVPGRFNRPEKKGRGSCASLAGLTERGNAGSFRAPIPRASERTPP